MSVERDIEIVAQTLEALSSEQQRISVNLDEIASLQQRIGVAQDKSASEQTKISSEQKKISSDLHAVLMELDRIGAKGTWAGRLGNVLYYAGLLCAGLVCLFFYNAQPAVGMRSDDWVILSVASAVPLAIGWTLRYVLSGKTS